MSFVLGLFTAAVVLPETGHSIPGVLVVSGGFLALTFWYGVAASRVAGQAHSHHPALTGSG